VPIVMRQNPSPLLHEAPCAGALHRAVAGRSFAGRAGLAQRALRAAGVATALLAAGACIAPLAHAERADRTKPMTVDSSGSTDVVDLSKHSAVFTGNVVITQGTLVIHADKVEVSEDPDGQRLGSAYGTPEHPATFRQKRDGEDQYSEGEAQKIEYDSAANRVRFIGAAHLRMLHGATVTDQASAALITYDTGTRSNGGSQTSTAGGRTTVVFTPKSASSAPSKRQPEPPLALPSSPAASGAAQ
jgi:lipopolysaccharide export system protein LptA